MQKRMVVLNPVINDLLTKEDVDILKEKLIKEFNADFITDPTIVMEKVKKSYESFLRHQKSILALPVIDSRCPAIRQLIELSFLPLRKLLAPVNSILIEGTLFRREEFEKKITCRYLVDIEMVIVAPCSYFRVYNNLIKGMKIITWKDLKNILSDFHPLEKYLVHSPVPLGFFDSLNAKIYKASGSNDCQQLLANIPVDAELLELLWCAGGCHKGDGL